MVQPQPLHELQEDGKLLQGSPFVPSSTWIRGGIGALLVLVCYYQVFIDLYATWTAPDSYYLHGFLIPPVSLYFAWRKRNELRATPIHPSAWGLILVSVSCLMLVLGNLLGIRLAGEISLIPIVAGIILAFLSRRHLGIVWFPVLFLVLMIPIPMSIIQSVALQIKLFATESAVRLAQLAMLPVIRDGSYVYFGDDHFIVGEVCGGLRSLISLVAVGAVVAYMSTTRPWARILLFIASGPVAILANISRIFVLCVVGYFFGSKTATGRFHDISGLLIFLVAFVLLFSLDTVLKRVAPERGAAQ